MRKLVAALAAVLLTASPAAAGGFSTIGFSPLPAEDSLVWTPTLTVKAHGVTPAEGAEPVVTIRNAATGETRTFPALPTAIPGEYRARVEFPAPGAWTYEIAEWKGAAPQVVRPIQIARTASTAAARPPAAARPDAAPPGPPPPAASSSPLRWALPGTAGALALAAGAVLLARRARTASATAAPSGR